MECIDNPHYLKQQRLFDKNRQTFHPHFIPVFIRYIQCVVFCRHANTRKHEHFYTHEEVVAEDGTRSGNERSEHTFRKYAKIKQNGTEKREEREQVNLRVNIVYFVFQLLFDLVSSFLIFTKNVGSKKPFLPVMGWKTLQTKIHDGKHRIKFV